MYIQVHLYIIFSTCSTKINFLLPHSDFTPIFPIYFPPFLIQKFAFIKMPASKKYTDPWILAMASDPIYIHSCWSVIPMWLYNQQEIKYTTVCLHSCPSATTGSSRFKKQKSSQINVYVLIFQVSEATCISQWHNLLFRVSFFFCSTAAWITFSLHNLMMVRAKMLLCEWWGSLQVTTQHASWIYGRVGARKKQEFGHPLEFSSLVKSCMQALNLCLLTVLAMLHLHQVQWHDCSLLAYPYKGLSCGPAVWSCGRGGGHWGSCWLSHFPLFWDQKGPMENHLWQIQPVFVTLPYPAA